MARAGSSSNAPLVPPDELDVAFLADGLLENETQVDRAKPFGVRPFTVDNVLDRLIGVSDSVEPPAHLVRFLWALLVRARESQFGTAHCAQRAEAFNPGDWFWCRPRSGDVDRNQQRARYIAMARLPARDGVWRAAGTLAFGTEWAEWLDSGACGPSTEASNTRWEAYRALDAISPSDDVMLAPPDVVLPLLDAGAFDDTENAATDDEQGELDIQRSRERHAFLLRLGVSEVIPVEAFSDTRTRDRDRFPWTGTLHKRRLELVSDGGGWAFHGHSWSGRQHRDVYASEDFRLRWDLEAAAHRNASELTRLLAIGAGFYSTRARMSVFCPGCSDSATGGRHSAHYHSTPSDNYPSILALQLREEPWVSALLDGRPVEEPVRPREAWWAPAYPSGGGLRQSSLRYLKVCHSELPFTDPLRRLCHITSLGEANPTAVLELLTNLRDEFDGSALPVNPRTSGRIAFSSLHRLAYGRLAQFAAQDGHIGERVEPIGVLCEIGADLGYRAPELARHDNGRFAAYRRYFGGAISFVELAPDRRDVAECLGVPAFEVELTRRGTDEGRDVTDDLQHLLKDRIPELLSVLVYYSLGAQTLELRSEAFEARTNRLRRLRVKQLANLVIDAVVTGTDVTVTIGEQSTQDLFLDSSTSAPVLYHDLNGEGWQERIRRMLSPHLAAVLQSPAYASTFRVLLDADDEIEREAFLQELGITAAEVEAIKASIGIVSEEDRRRASRWFGAIVAAMTATESVPEIASARIVDALVAAGLPEQVARRLHDLGDTDARTDVSQDGALWILKASGVDLTDLDRRLRPVGYIGLDIRVARSRLRSWLQQNERRVAAVLAIRESPEAAKSAPSTWRVPAELSHELDPADDQWMSPVLEALRTLEFEPDVAGLLGSPAAELARLAGVSATEELDERVSQLYDAEERANALRRFAAVWRRHLVLLGILARMSAGDGRAAIRAHEAAVEGVLPLNPEAPSVLRAALDDLLAAHPDLVGAVAAQLSDSLASGPPERDSIRQLAAEHGLLADLFDLVIKALEAPRNAAVRQLRQRISDLAANKLDVQPPVGLEPAKPKPSSSAKPRRDRPVRMIKVTPKSDRRKREAGDDAERWALAALVGRLSALPSDERKDAVESILELLDALSLKGPAVDAARAHAVPACDASLDEDELVEELSQLLHVSSYSDHFGFDMLGWLEPYEGSAPQAMCVEVKGTRDGGFHLSRGEWLLAEEMNADDSGDAYGVLVVRRARGGGPPSALDLLADPVSLVAGGQLSKVDDGYVMTYTVRSADR